MRFNITVKFLFIVFLYSRQVLGEDFEKCYNHSKWVLDNKNTRVDWNSINSINEARRWLSCFEPDVCAPFNQNNCQQLQNNQGNQNVNPNNQGNQNVNPNNQGNQSVNPNNQANQNVNPNNQGNQSVNPNNQGNQSVNQNNQGNQSNLRGNGYSLEDLYTGMDFMNKWYFQGGNDPTHGAIWYVDKNTAQKNNLVSFPNNKFRTDIGQHPVRNGVREAVRVQTTKRYNGGLFVLDYDRMPEGAATWPAFWMTGPEWPCSGEIDVIEVVNTISNETSENHSTLHTMNSCIQQGVRGISNNGMCGAKKTPGNNSCLACGKKGDCPYTGCGISQGQKTGGYAFNRTGGGVYAVEWIFNGTIKMWFFPRNEVTRYFPSNDAPVDPSTWPQPYASFNPCPGAFKDNMIIINTTLCGDWADGDFSRKGLGNCRQFVANQNNKFTEAYWLINSVRVYQKKK